MILIGQSASFTLLESASTSNSAEASGPADRSPHPPPCSREIPVIDQCVQPHSFSDGVKSRGCLHPLRQVSHLFSLCFTLQTCSSSIQCATAKIKCVLKDFGVPDDLRLLINVINPLLTPEIEPIWRIIELKAEALHAQQ